MISALLLALVAVLPSDRLAMADRLFNRARYAEAVREYRSLAGEPSLAADELEFRIAECERELGHTNAAAAAYRELVDRHPGSAQAPRSRLQLALLSDAKERESQLRALASDRLPADIRAAAFYHRGIGSRDPELLAAAVAADPKGPYSSAAGYARAAILAESDDPSVGRKGVELLLTFAFSNCERAEMALYLAASQSYRQRRYADAGNLFRRYVRRYPRGPQFAAAERMAVWCDYLVGRYAEAAAACGNRAEEDFVYLRAACAFGSGEFAAAERKFREYLERFPSGAYRSEAELALARQEFSVAAKGTNAVWTVETAERVYRQSQTPADALRLGWAYAQAGRAEAAEAAYRQVTERAPGTAESAAALYARAMLAARAENWSKTELLLAEATAGGKLGERAASADYWRGVAAIRLGHEAEARKLLCRALAAKLTMDEDREARLMVAELDLKAGHRETAIAAYRRLIAEGAAERMSATRLKAVGELLGGAEMAVCARELLRQTDPEWRQVGGAMLGAAEESQGAYTAAIRAYRGALAEKATTAAAARAALQLGALELRAGEYDRAEETLRQAVRLNADHPRTRAQAYLKLAETAAAKGDRKAAAGYATVVVSLFNDPELTGPAQRILKANPEVVP